VATTRAGAPDLRVSWRCSNVASMDVLRRVALVALLGLVATGAFVAWNVYGAWPVPNGYAFPRHPLWGGGPAALYTGTLLVQDGCILTEDGDTVIWPPFSSLAVVEGIPVIRIAGREIGMGARVELGGGWYDQDYADDVATGVRGSSCPSRYFLTTGPAG
jgi:hypothetical protein